MFNVLALPYFRQRSGLRRSGSGSFLLPDAQPRSGAAWQEPRSPRRSRTKPPLASGPGLIATARAITAAAIVSIEDNVGLLLSASLLEGASTDDTTPTFRGTTSSSTTKTGNTLYLWSRHLVSGVFSLRGSVNLARGISNGSWQITSAPLPQGTHSFFVSTVSTTPTALPPSGSRTLTIDTSAPLLSAALGEVIQLADGTYRDAVLQVRSNGITVRAQTPGGVILAGSQAISSSGHDTVFRGFRFEDGSVPGAVLRVTGSRNLLTELSFDGYRAQKYIILDAASQFNAITWSHFAHKPADAPIGNLIHIDPHPSMPGYHRISRNSFQNLPGAGGDYGNEPIRIGNSAQSSYSSRTLVEYNFFSDTGGGDSEAISVKSRDNVLRWNTMRDNPNAMFVFRHGDDNAAYGNVFIRSGGIRVAEANRIWIANNHFESAGVGGSATAFSYDAAAPYLQGIRVIHNTFVEPDVIALGSGGTDNTWANNLFLKSSGALFSGSPSGLQWAGNLHQGSLGSSLPEGASTAVAATGLAYDPVRGIHVLQPGSPAIDRASATYPTLYDVPGLDDDFALSLDVQGQGRPAERERKDVGADEWAATAGPLRPLSPEEVGPSYRHAHGLGGDPALQPRVEGGGGVDTVAFAAAGLSLDLADPGNPAASRLAGIEAFDLGVAGLNGLTLSQAALRRIARRNWLNAGTAAGLGFSVNGALPAQLARHQLLIHGDGEDTLQLSDGLWSRAPQTLQDAAGASYALFNSADGLDQLIVSSALSRMGTLAGI